MKIGCPCGAVIHDNTDFEPDKAYLLADQDLCRLEEVADHDAVIPLDVSGPLWRTIYQCWSCGRLTLADPVTGKMLWFAPENDERKKALGSSEGNAFKVSLTGRWRPNEQRGEVSWGSGGDQEGGFEEFDDKAAFERRYHQVFRMLSQEGRLHGASLNGEETKLLR